MHDCREQFDSVRPSIIVARISGFREAKKSYRSLYFSHA